MPAALAKPIFGVIARTAFGKSCLKPEHLQPLVSRWKSADSSPGWWINTQDGVAMLKPDLEFSDPVGGRESCLCIRGSVSANKIVMPQKLHTAAEPGGLHLLLFSLMEHDLDTMLNLRGNFSLACWDGDRKVLWLVRDHLGQRCLFYRTDTHFIYFCSELSPLLRSTVFSTELDEEAAFWYLSFGTPPPGRTLAKNVGRVPAGHALRWSPGGHLETIRYWTPLVADAPGEVTPQYVAECREKLTDVIASKLDDEKAKGLLLSGGVDSTFIASTARMLGKEIQTFTCAFDEKYGINETGYAAEVARWLGYNNHIVPISEKQALSNIHEVILQAPEPCSAWAAITHFYTLSLTQNMNVKIMFSGLGADEIFGGYDHFRGYYSRYLRYLSSHSISNGMDPFDAILADSSRSAGKVLYPGIARFFDDVSLRKGLAATHRNWQYRSHQQQFYQECRRIKPEAQVMEMMIAHECQHRIPDLLHAGFDPLSRRMGVEMFYPFLDPDIVQLACGLSVTSRYRTPSGKFSLRLKKLLPGFKYALMKVAEDRVPPAILQRPRGSYTAPFGQWLFHSEFSQPLLEKLQKSRFWETGMLKKEYMNEILARVVPAPNPWVFQLWAILTLAGWYDYYVEKEMG